MSEPSQQETTHFTVDLVTSNKAYWPFSDLDTHRVAFI
ncbi:hypothetical protein D018_0257 [Vibrio parahaemolyticus VP2007-007]|nr:hypothetical protein D018_0257 [Vibrio parahaemolyticus VP2007-007]